MKILCKFLALGFLFISFNSFSGVIEKSYKHSDFETASKSQNFVKFSIESTKAGMWTSVVDGYVKNFDFAYEKKTNKWVSGQISFKITQLDTDSDGRDEKMHEFCLDSKKADFLVVKVNTPMQVTKNMKVPATILIRGKEKDIGMMVSITSIDGGHIIEGSSEVSFSALQIPDPSIFIAKVADKIKISFKLKI